MQFVRMLILWVLAATVASFFLRLYMRSVRRENLEKRWDENNPDGLEAEREAYVERGMEEFEEALWPKLIAWGIYVIPFIFIVVVHIFTTYY